MNKDKWFLNGGRGSGRTVRFLCETYENKIADLEKENAELKKACDETQELLDKQIEATYKLDKENADLQHKLDTLQGYLDHDIEYDIDKTIQELRKENTELKKNYEDSLVAYGVLKAKIDLLARPSPLESMQDVLITTQKIANEKQKEQLTKAKRYIKELLKAVESSYSVLSWQRPPIKAEAEQFLKDCEVEK